MNQDLRAYLAECIGTFALVFAGTTAITLSAYFDQGAVAIVPIALAFGFVLMTLVLSIGPVSGCHVNPAVTIGVALAGRLPMAKVPGYIISQIVGAILASLVLMSLMKGFPNYDVAVHGLGQNGNPAGISNMSLLGFEVVSTALFLMTILGSTRTGSPAGFASIAIGGYLLVALIIGAPFGDASLNPARSIGPAIFAGGDALKVLWIFIVGPIVGGIIGMLLYRGMYADKVAG